MGYIYRDNNKSKKFFEKIFLFFKIRKNKARI